MSTADVTTLRDSMDTYTTPKLYLSNAEYIQNPENARDWLSKDIGLVINVTVDTPASKEAQQLYQQLGIDYLYAPIYDNNEKLPSNYLDGIVDNVIKWTKRKPYERWHKNILVHCTAGINRSALVAAAILWYTTPNRKDFWSTPQELINYMKARQFRDRKQFLLLNNNFVNVLQDYLR
jgi:protein-tyrosine phosphatase